MNIAKKTLDRRALLKSFGFAGLVAGTLMDRRRAFAAGGVPPRRLILFYTPGGFFHECFQPDETWSGANAGKPVDLPLGNVTFGKIRKGARQNVLEALDDPKYAGIKQDINVIDGVDMRAVERSDEHHNGIKAALRGRPIQEGDLGPFPNMSIDRVIGQHLFLNSERPVHLKSACLNMGIGNFGYQGSIRDASEGGTGLETTSVTGLWDGLFKDFMPGASMGPTGPSPSLVDAYERRKLLSAHSRGELEGLKRLLGKDEQVALDRHLEAMNEITLQVENTYKTAMSGGAGVSRAAAVPARPTRSYDPKRDLVAMTTDVANIVAQAMAFDRVRVATLHTFGQNNNTSHWYPGATGAYHNGVCHGGRLPAGGGQNYVVPAAMSAGKTLVRLFLDIVLKLKSIPEGDGTMLDSTTVATFNDMSNGDHQYKVSTLFMTAGGGGLVAPGKRYFKTGRYIKFVDRGHNDYLVSLAHAMSVTEWKDGAGNRKPLVQIGSVRYNKGPLPGLTG